MRSLIRCAMAGFALVVVLTVVYMLLLLAPERTGAESLVFVSRNPEDVEYVFVQNESGSFRFYFDFEEGGYVVDDIPPYITDINAFTDFLANSARIFATRRISLGHADFAEVGLAEPHAEVEIGFFDGKVLRITIGEEERVSGNFYATVEGETFIIPQMIAEPFLLPKTQVISRFVTPQLAVSSPLSAIRDITFTGSSLAQPITIQANESGNTEVALVALSFGAPTHIVKGGGVYQLDQTYGIEILGSLFGIEAFDIAGYGLSDEEVAAFGFDQPYMAVDYFMANGVDADVREMRLRLTEAANNRFYATLEGSGVVYIINRKPFMDIRYDRLLQRWFLTPLIMDLSAVSIESPEGYNRFDIDNSDPRNPIITHNGRVLDVELFRSFYRLITSAAHDGAYLGILEQPQEPALLTITYTYSSLEKEPDSLSLYPGAVRRVNAFVNGVGEFAMRDLFVQQVIDGAENLIEGMPIEENW